MVSENNAHVTIILMNTWVRSFLAVSFLFPLGGNAKGVPDAVVSLSKVASKLNAVRKSKEKFLKVVGINMPPQDKDYLYGLMDSSEISEMPEFKSTTNSITFMVSNETTVITFEKGSCFINGKKFDSTFLMTAEKKIQLIQSLLEKSAYNFNFLIPRAEASVIIAVEGQRRALAALAAKEAQQAEEAAIKELHGAKTVCGVFQMTLHPNSNAHYHDVSDLVKAIGEVYQKAINCGSDNTEICQELRKAAECMQEPLEAFWKDPGSYISFRNNREESRFGQWTYTAKSQFNDYLKLRQKSGGKPTGTSK